MTKPVPINPEAPARQSGGLATDSSDGPWEVLISEREANEAFTERAWIDRSRDYETHDRIGVGLGLAPEFHPATVAPRVLNIWIHVTARDAGDATRLRSSLEMLLVQAWMLGWRDSFLSTRIPEPLLKEGWADHCVETDVDDDDGDGDTLLGHSPITADQAMDVMEDVFGPRNGWSVVTQGVVERDWYQNLDPKTQSAFILRCKNIAVAFDHDMALWPRSIQPETIIAWIDEQSKNDNVAAGYYVAFCRLIGSCDKQDWRLKVLSPSFADLWSGCAPSPGDSGEPA